jgi:hypothetical protein
MPTFDISQLLLPKYSMASITYWNRLDSYPRSHDVGRSLKAEVRDALWMLTRQWQFGELKGEDAGSPLCAKLSARHITPPSVTINQKVVPYDLSVPIEAIAEKEEVVPTLRLRVQMGRMFIRLLKANNVAHNDFFIREFQLALPSDTEIKTTQFFAAVRARVPDGFAIFKKAKAGISSFFSGLSNVTLNVEEQQAVTNVVLVQFIKWYDQLYFQSPKNETAWLPERMEYSFTVNTSSSAANGVSLQAPEYLGGRLDWSDFDVHINAGAPATTTTTPVVTSEEKGDLFLPTIVSYRGMPNPRFWQMEEGSMDFGKIEQSPAGIVGLLLAEYGLTYSNDWFLLPWPIKTNTLCGMQGILVTDVFGQRNFVAPASMTPDAQWQQFALFAHSQQNQTAAKQQLFYLPAVTGAVQSSDPLEKVYFMRDEMANLMWAIEDVVPAQTGGGRKIVSTLPEPVPENPDPATWQYILGTTVPEHWIPFVAVHKPGSDTEIRLQRGRIPNAKPPQSLLLTESQPVQFIEAQEVPRSGVIVERAVQRVRWLNGKTYLWIGRRKLVGRGEGSSGLEFDKLN